MTNKITQQSPEWLEKKQPRIGGSEIYSLAAYYCQAELQKLGIDLIKEPPFKSALEVYLRVKFQCKEQPIDPVLSEFGLGVENYITSRLNAENPNLQIEGTRDFIINEDIHKLACCSPDGYIEVKEGQILRDFDDTCDISSKMGKGTLEIKTTRHDFNLKAEEGTRWQYLFQLQYNMMLLGHKWGMLACLTPKEKEYDDPFFKGKIIGLLKGVEIGMYEWRKKIIKEIDNYYNLYTYPYSIIKPIQDICKLALQRFQEALDKDNGLPMPSRDNLIKLTREKKMLASLYDEGSRFDTLKADEELNGLLNNRHTASSEAAKAASEKAEYDIEILKRMGDHVEIKGLDCRAFFDAAGRFQVRTLNKELKKSLNKEINE
jgi:hypothetical protein